MTDLNKDKQAMQNTIKTLQAKTDYIYGLQNKASKVLVLELGSHSIKMGFANQRVPFIIKPMIAYKKKILQTNEVQKETNEEINQELFKKQYMNMETYLKNECVINSDNRPIKGKPRGKQIITFDKIPTLHQQKTILFGQEALAVENDPQYIFRKPMKHGQFNLLQPTHNQLQSCINDVEKLLKFLITQKMGIPAKERKLFSCILIVPDVFIREHIKALISMIFNQLGFQKLYFHLESVLACLGTAVSSALVVDIGHQKINVCCVDEGIILPKTLIRKNYGLKNISQSIVKIVNSRLGEESVNLSIGLEGDLYQVDQIKDTACAIKQPEQTPNKVYEIRPVREREEHTVHINYNDSICVAANSIFTYMWNSFPHNLPFPQLFDYNSELYSLVHDPEDLFEEYSGGGNFYSIQEDNPKYSKSLINPFVYEPIEQIIAASLMSIKDVEVRKKFLSSILVIGGGGYIPQLNQEIIKRVSNLFENPDFGGDKAQQSLDLFLRQIPPNYASWLGGTVLPKLDSLRDLWIQKSKYIGQMKEELVEEEEDEPILDKKLFTRKEESQEWGIRYLKQKIPFLW